MEFWLHKTQMSESIRFIFLRWWARLNILNFVTASLHSNVCRLLTLISISTHFLLLLLLHCPNTFDPFLFYIMNGCTSMWYSWLAWHFWTRFYKEVCCFISLYANIDEIRWNRMCFCLQSVCRICLHSIMDDTFGERFDVTACIAVLNQFNTIFFVLVGL